jgi:type IV secretion system protein TrbD
MALRRVTLHRAGIRPHLFLGGDRELVLFSGLIACVLIFACFQPVTIAMGIGLWMFALFFFRRMAKADPRMRYVYMRHLLYRRYYPARSTPYRDNGRPNISAFTRSAK